MSKTDERKRIGTCPFFIVLGPLENGASTASTGELLGTEMVQNPMHTTSAVFLSGTMITVLTLASSYVGVFGQFVLIKRMCSNCRQKLEGP